MTPTDARAVLEAMRVAYLSPHGVAALALPATHEIAALDVALSALALVERLAREYRLAPRGRFDDYMAEARALVPQEP